MNEANKQVAALTAEQDADPTARARKLLLQRGWDLFLRKQGPVEIRLAAQQGVLMVVLDTPNGQVLLGKAKGKEAAELLDALVSGIAAEAGAEA